MMAPALIHADVFHGRKGSVRNAFRYRVHFLLLNADRPQRPRGVALNGPGLWSVHDRDHGDGLGSLAQYAARVRQRFGLERACDGDTLLLTQPRCLFYLFNPVSFWFFRDRAGAVRAVLVEVNNVDRQRHSYLCAHPDRRPIRQEDEMTVGKVFHVSPFQPVDGQYRMRFALPDGRVEIAIRYESDSDDGVIATLRGATAPVTRARMAAAFLRAPLGAGRVMALILLQALRLKLKGALFRRTPAPPAREISQ